MPISTQRRNGSGPVIRSLSPCGRLPSYRNRSPSISSSSSFVASTSSSFSSPVPSTFFNAVTSNGSSIDHNHHQQHHGHCSHQRSASPTRVNLYTSSPSFNFSIDNRSISPNRSITVAPKKGNPISLPKKTCMCSPTTHPGSFRCSLHKNSRRQHHHQQHGSGSGYLPNRLNMMRSAMKNSLVRIGGVEGEWVKRALTALIRPSSHQQRRRADFQPRPSRLSIMSMAAADDNRVS